MALGQQKLGLILENEDDKKFSFPGYYLGKYGTSIWNRKLRVSCYVLILWIEDIGTFM